MHWYRTPIAVYRVLDWSSRFLNPNSSSFSKSVASRNLVMEMAVVGRGQEACLLSQMLLKLELAQADRPESCRNVDSFFAVYGAADPQNKMTKEEWLIFSQPALDQANLIYDKYQKSLPSSPLRGALGPDSYRVDQIYQLLGNYYRDHGCIEKEVECRKMAVRAVSETLGSNSAHYHNYLLQLAKAYKLEHMDSAARAAVEQSLGTLSELKPQSSANNFIAQHKVSCQELLKALQN